LAEHDISVMLQAASPHLWSSWPTGLRWPANAHRIGAGLATSFSVTRDGKLLATIAVDDPAQLPAGQLSAVPSGWQIHLPTAHLAGAGTTVRTIYLHGHGLNAGWRPVQGVNAHECGPHGCTLIEIDATSEPRHMFVPAAPVRWERIPIYVSAETSRDDLVQDMASRLEQTPWQTCEKVWLIAWDVTGAGQLYERLGNRIFRDELLIELIALDPVPGVRIHTHAVRLHMATDSFRPIVDGGPLLEPNGFEQRGHEKNLADEFAMRLEERFADPEQALGACLAGSLPAGEPWLLKIESLVAQLDAREVAQDARGAAMQWFAEPLRAEHGPAEQGELAS
jgi:hypothetical protein